MFQRVCIGHLSFLGKYVLVPAIILGILHTLSLILALILGGWCNFHFVIQASEAPSEVKGQIQGYIS